MPHAKEHPLAGYFVVPHPYLLTGETVRVIDWLDRCGELVGAWIPPGSMVCFSGGRRLFYGGWNGTEAAAPDELVAAVRGGSEALILQAGELPSYDPALLGENS